MGDIEGKEDRGQWTGVGGWVPPEGDGAPEADKLLRCGGRSRPYGHGRRNKAEVGEGGGRYRL